MPIDHPDDVYGGGLLDGDEVTYDETTNNRNGKLKAINVAGGTGGNSWGRVMKARATAGARAAPARATERARATVGARAIGGATHARATAGARTAVTRRATTAARVVEEKG